MAAVTKITGGSIGRYAKTLHGRILFITLGSVILVSVFLSSAFLTISYLSIKRHFAQSNQMILGKLEKLISVPLLKQDFSMIVDIIDAERKASHLQFIWVLDEDLNIIASNDETLLLSPVPEQLRNDPDYSCIRSVNGYRICILPDYGTVYHIGIAIFIGTCTAICIIFVFLSIWTNRLGRAISDPIGKAVEASSDIADGHFDIAFGKSQIPEINILFTSLTDTASKLKSLTESLENEKEKLKESEQKYRRLVENMPDTYFFFSRMPDGGLLYVSPSITKILGYLPEEMKEKMKEYLTDNPLNRQALISQKLVSKGTKPKPFEVEVYHKEGSTRILEVLEVPVINPEGKILLMEGIARDITIQKQVENNLIQAQKMETVGTLAGGIAHDFNNILGGIVGTLSIMKYKMNQNGSLTNEELDGYLSVLDNASQNASEMVNQILTISRKQEFQFTPLDLNNTVRHVMKICNNSFDKSILICPTYMEGGKVMTMADPVQIEQVVLNLCVNAYHAMTLMRGEEEKWGGKLTVSLSFISADAGFRRAHPEAEEIPYWIIAVSDEGVGMDAKTASKIFDPFFTTKGKGVGSGLGLAIVYNIVKQHQGFIDVYSEPGRGTTMRVYLPVYFGEDTPETDTKKECLYQGEGLILVVDDEEIIRNAAKTILEECGYSVITAEDGVQALEIYRLRSQKIKAVLLDLVMPKKSGREVFEEMKAINGEIKLILASGFRMDERVQKILDLGAHAFVQKPFTMEQISKAFSDMLQDTKG